MPEGTILIVGGRTETVRKAVDLGLSVVLVQHKDRLQPEQVRLADAVLLVDYTDWSVLRPLVRAAHDVYGFTSVVSLVEQAMENVGRINDLLGLNGTPYRVAHLFKDKCAMRRHLLRCRLGGVAAAPVEDADALRDFGRRHGYPLVVKPIDGTGSRGVLRVDDAAGIDGAWRQVQELRTRTDLTMGNFFPVDRFLVEQYVEGPEYSVETFTFDGRHVVVAITEKLTMPNFIEVGHAQPARLAPDDELALSRCIGDFLDAVGLDQGPAHTEVRLSATGPRVIESHDRIGGDRIGDLVEAAYGIDLERYSVGWPFRLLPELTERPRPLQASATRFLVAEPGTVVEVQGAEDVRGAAEVVGLDIGVAAGDTVPVLTDSFDRVGQVLTVGADTGAAMRNCENYANKITIVTE